MAHLVSIDTSLRLVVSAFLVSEWLFAHLIHIRTSNNVILLFQSSLFLRTRLYFYCRLINLLFPCSSADKSILLKITVLLVVKVQYECFVAYLFSVIDYTILISVEWASQVESALLAICRTAAVRSDGPTRSTTRYISAPSSRATPSEVPPTLRESSSRKCWFQIIHDIDSLSYGSAFDSGVESKQPNSAIRKCVRYVTCQLYCRHQLISLY